MKSFVRKDAWPSWQMVWAATRADRRLAVLPWRRCWKSTKWVRPKDPNLLCCRACGRHTIGFEPDTFVDVTAEWDQAIDWLGRLMALVRNEPYRSGTRDPAQQLKETLAAYRGKTCGAKYAEAVRAIHHIPREIL